MKYLKLVFFAISLAITANVQAEEQGIVWDLDKGTVDAQEKEQ